MPSARRARNRDWRQRHGQSRDATRSRAPAEPRQRHAGRMPVFWNRSACTATRSRPARCIYGEVVIRPFLINNSGSDWPIYMQIDRGCVLAAPHGRATRLRQERTRPALRTFSRSVALAGLTPESSLRKVEFHSCLRAFAETPRFAHSPTPRTNALSRVVPRPRVAPPPSDPM